MFVICFGESGYIVSCRLGTCATHCYRFADLQIHADGEICCATLVDNRITGKEGVILYRFDQGDVGAAGTDDHVIDSVPLEQLNDDVDIIHVIRHLNTSGLVF